MISSRSLAIGTAIVAGVLSMAHAAPAAAYFEDVDVGARAQGMGTAGVAVVDDVSALFWNPSALAGLSRPEALAAYGKPLGVAGLYTGAIAVAGRGPGPLRGSGFALGWQRYGIRGAYSEDLFRLAAGHTIARSSSGHELAVGGALKAGRVGVSDYADPQTGAAVQYGSRSELSFDTAARWRAPWKVDVVWVASDWTSPDYRFIDTDAGRGAEVPTRHRVGISYRWNSESTVGAAWTSADAHGRSRLDVGLEIWFYDVFAIRSGLTDLGGLPDPDTSPKRFQYAGGIGLRDTRWRLDAAVATTYELGTSYRFSLTVPFGSASPGHPR